MEICYDKIAFLGFPGSSATQLVKSPSAMLETQVRFLSQEDPLEKGLTTHSSILGLPWWLRQKEHIYNAGDLGSVPGLGRSLGWKDPLEEGMATYSSNLFWRIPWTEETWQVIGCQRFGHN